MKLVELFEFVRSAPKNGPTDYENDFLFDGCKNSDLFKQECKRVADILGKYFSHCKGSKYFEFYDSREDGYQIWCYKSEESRDDHSEDFRFSPLFLCTSDEDIDELGKKLYEIYGDDFEDLF